MFSWKIKRARRFRMLSKRKLLKFKFQLTETDLSASWDIVNNFKHLKLTYSEYKMTKVVKCFRVK